MRQADVPKMQARLRAAGLSERCAEAVARLARPAISLNETEQTAAADVPLGTSKFLGLPDLPKGTIWPRRPPYPRLEDERVRKLEVQERPLGFLGQINLREVNQLGGLDFDLPTHGLLSLFYDLECGPWGFKASDRVGWGLLWHAEDDLMRLPQPLEQPQGFMAYFALDVGVRISLSAIDVVPDPSLPICQEALFNDEASYREWADFRGEDFTPSVQICSFIHPYHRLGGWSVPIQAPMEKSCHRMAANLKALGIDAAQSKGPEDWVTLLQLTSHSRWLRWYDQGMLYLWMTKHDLQQSKFDRSWLKLQSG